MPSPPRSRPAARPSGRAGAPRGAAPRGGSPDRAAAIGLFVALGATALVFAPVTGLGFIGSNWDDALNLFENPLLRLPLGEGLARFWSAPYFASYIPVTRTVWVLLWHASPEPWVFHAANLLVHLLAVGLVFALLRRLAFGAAASTIGALVFAVHPVQVEAVAWATGMKDLLGAAFTLLALWLALGRLERATERPGPAAWAVSLPAAIVFGAAMLSKPSAAAAPLVLVALARMRGHAWRSVLASVAPWLLVLAPCALVARAAEFETALGAPVVSGWQRPLVFADAIGFYLSKLVAPFPLGVDYGRSPATVLALPWWPPFAIGAVACAIAVAVLGRRQRALGAGALVFVAALLPVSGLVPFLFQNISTVADRYLYPAVPGIAIVVAGLVGARPRRAWLVASSAILCVLAALAFAQVPHWRDERTLFEHALRVNPGSRIAGMHVAVQRATGGKLEEALVRLREVRRRNPGFSEAHANLGHVFHLLGRPDSSIASFAEAVRLEPGQAEFRANFAQVLAAAGRYGEAEVQAAAGLRIAPSSPHVRASAAFVDSLARAAAGNAAATEDTRRTAP